MERVDHESFALDSVDIIVEALREKFGDRAEEIARAQVDRASTETAGKWLAIVGRLAQV